MRAILCRRQPGGALAGFEDVEVAVPSLQSPEDLLVRVEAASLNPIDFKRRAARPDPDPEGAVLGWSGVGLVEAVGSAVRHITPGQRVWYAGASERPGAFAEFQRVDARIAGLAPTRLPPDQAAAMPLAGLTASEALYDHLDIESAPPGHTILVNGGAGAVASLAVQLARQVHSMVIIATAGSAKSRDRLLRLGADHVADHRLCLWQQVLQMDCPKPRSILSMHTNKRTWESYIAMLQPFGDICLVDHPHHLDFAAARAKSIALHWQAMFTRPRLMYEASRQGAHLTRLARLCDREAVKPLPVQRAMPMRASEIGRAMDRDQHSGQRCVFVSTSGMK